MFSRLRTPLSLLLSAFLLVFLSTSVFAAETVNILSSNGEEDIYGNINLQTHDQITFTLNKREVKEWWGDTIWPADRSFSESLDCSVTYVDELQENFRCRVLHRPEGGFDVISMVAKPSTVTQISSNAINLRVRFLEEGASRRCINPPNYALVQSCEDVFQDGIWQRNARFECEEDYKKLRKRCVIKKKPVVKTRPCILPNPHIIEDTCVDQYYNGIWRRNYNFKCEKGYRRQGKFCIQDLNVVRNNFDENCYIKDFYYLKEEWYYIEALDNKTSKRSKFCEVNEWFVEAEAGEPNNVFLEVKQDPRQLKIRRGVGGKIRIQASQDGLVSKVFKKTIPASYTYKPSDEQSLEEQCYFEGESLNKEWYVIKLLDNRLRGESPFCAVDKWLYDYDFGDDIRVPDGERMVIRKEHEFQIRKMNGGELTLSAISANSSIGPTKEHRFLIPSIDESAVVKSVDTRCKMEGTIHSDEWYRVRMIDGRTGKPSAACNIVSKWHFTFDHDGLSRRINTIENPDAFIIERYRGGELTLSADLETQYSTQEYSYTVPASRRYENLFSGNRFKTLKAKPKIDGANVAPSGTTTKRVRLKRPRRVQRIKMGHSFTLEEAFFQDWDMSRGRRSLGENDADVITTDDGEVTGFIFNRRGRYVLKGTMCDIYTAQTCRKVRVRFNVRK